MRHGQRPADGAPQEVLGWGTFGSVLAAVLVAITGSGWIASVLILALGVGATGLLWLAGSLSDRPRRAGEPGDDQQGHRSGRHQQEPPPGSRSEGDLGA